MPKLKSNRGAVKRFRVTGGGKIRRRRAGHSHLLTGKSRRRKRRQRTPAIVDARDARLIRQLAPYL
ncbi:MAG TPA: 50S ribosomal protein L35 [Thermodesulfobacteriota bacterium]|nr:50S ribosomal protein L35 [Thermodesulfobacteriota bacterium]